MAVVYTPTLRGRRLALELRRLRAQSGLTITEAARRVSWDKSKLSRVEKPETGIGDEDLRALLQMYGVAVDRHTALLQLNQDAWQRGWWTVYGDAFTGNFPMLENHAEEISSYENACVPGLFQTADYATEVFRRLLPAADEAEVGRRVDARMARKTLLTRTAPPSVHAVIDEAAIRRVIGGPETMSAQIAELWRVAQLPDVTIQVVPLDAVANAGMNGPFTIFGHPSEPGLDVAHAEGQLGEWYAESAEELTRIRLVMQSVAAVALSPEETAEFLAALTRE